MLYDVGVYGLAVMGRNLALNIRDHGYKVAVGNRSHSKIDSLLQEAPDMKGCYSFEEFAAALSKPRKIILMVQAGPTVDSVIEGLMPYLEKGDVIVDGGNSHFPDTMRRSKAISETGVMFMGMGVSGGEEGARNGPAIMPGGSSEAYALMGKILCDISAKVGGDPCCSHIDGDGAGHYVKMVHNGIEYADMQLISEAYMMMRSSGMNCEEMADVFEKWNEGELDSYLIWITSRVLRKKDSDTGDPLVEKIVDAAGQKGTGAWSSMSALELGVSIPTIAAAVFSRSMSSIKEERVSAAKKFAIERKGFAVDSETLRKALYAAKICAYAQGFALMDKAGKEYGWDLHLGEISQLFRGGCIIRARFLHRILDAYKKCPTLKNLMLDDYFGGVLQEYHGALREIVQLAAKNGVAVSAFSSALAYFDEYTTAAGGANLIQGQRDFFGAHTYLRLDKPGVFHTQWEE